MRAASLGTALPPVIDLAPPASPMGDADLLAQDAPAITLAGAADLARDLYGITGDIRQLSAEKDANFRIRLDGGEEALLKITNAAEDRAVTDMQTQVLIHLAAVDPTLPVPRVHASLSGAASEIISGAAGQSHVVRLLGYLPGTVLAGAEAAPAMHEDLGVLLGRLTRAMRGFFHPAAGHELQWDIKQAHRLRPMLEAVAEDDLRARLTALLDRFDADIAPQLPHLRAQVVHNDFNPHNLLVDAARATRPTGIIDFGDMVHTPVACDLAVACSYQIVAGPDPLAHITRMIRGYSRIMPLEEEEIALLPDLIRLRHLTTLTLGAWRARRYPQNADYILRNTAASRRGLSALDAMAPGAPAAALREAARVRA
ncbi:aminoglycoside phosphotransferase [Pelagivirga sediminicola]|uniref:Hydroxylysine kinase n=1 Tax=Pelagivirga sediminicola TaxID=2170575 RepID=A0A2T7G3X5_9RHOB|nr:phosphotransferase [Pelagivirga sediminicola]PVA09119.1 aminoglycoside phosphotransferase [Pelagivirga sediminicola]